MEIFIAQSPKVKTLEGFVQTLVPGLSLENIEERESSNYAEGHYFKAKLKGSNVQLSYLDTEGLEQWAFLIVVSDMSAESLNALAKNVAALGFGCFVPQGQWQLESWVVQGVHYGP